MSTGSAIRADTRTRVNPTVTQEACCSGVESAENRKVRKARWSHVQVVNLSFVRPDGQQINAARCASP